MTELRWRSGPVRRLLLDSITLLALGCAALLLGWLSFAAPRAADLPMSTPSAIAPARSFNDLERFPDRRPFRWTTSQSRLAVPNPGGQVHLRLLLIDGPVGRTSLTVDAPRVSLSFAVLPGMRRYELLLPPSGGERVELVFSSPTADMAGRSLGVGVVDPRVAGGGALPLQAVPALVIATLGCYVLLRQAGYGRPAASGIVLALLFLLALWLHAGGWQYGLLGRGLGALGAAALVAAALDRWQRRSVALGRWLSGAGGQSSVVGGRSSVVGGPLSSVLRPSLVLPALLLLALAARVPWLLAPDPTGDLELAARRMYYLFNEGLAGAYRRGGDYMPLRLYYLWAASQVVGAAGASFAEPIAPLTKLLVKLPQLLADVAMVAVIYAYARRRLAAPGAALLAAMYTLAPPVWINSAWWGQVDAWLMLGMVGAVLLVGRGDGRWGWACWALALLVKTQAIIVAPVLFVATLRRSGSRGLVHGAATAGGVLAAGLAPLGLAGQGFGMAEAYLGAVGRFPRTTYGAYNLWHLALGGATVNDFNAALGPISYRQIGLALLAAAVVLVCVALWRRSDAAGRVLAAGALALAFFCLPTQMHARYLFLPLAFVALAARDDRRLVVLFLALAAGATVNMFGILSGFWLAATALIVETPLPLACAVVNLAVLAVLLWRLLRAPALREPSS
ncbi:MAG: hypothetical protein RLZZ387_3504 [Chloroflexota bacterium]